MNDNDDRRVNYDMSGWSGQGAESAGCDGTAWCGGGGWGAGCGLGVGSGSGIAGAGGGAGAGPRAVRGGPGGVSGWRLGRNDGRGGHRCRHHLVAGRGASAVKGGRSGGGLRLSGVNRSSDTDGYGHG